MARFDEARFALEAASGGRNTILLDDVGMPSVMVRIPSFRWSEVIEGGDDAVCSAFIVGGEAKDCIYISKYLNIIENGRAYSLPNRDPAHNIKMALRCFEWVALLVPPAGLKIYSIGWVPSAMCPSPPRNT
jgi:hypothetical protein